jgi:hypothetical protein
MERWIGNNPTLTQQNMSTKYKRELTNAEHTVIHPNEIILKAIEAELDKRSGYEIDGVLTLTSAQLLLISKTQTLSFEYSTIRNIQIKVDGKDKNEWKLTFFSGRNKYEFDDIKKNDDTEEFFYILQEKARNPHQGFQTTVTHDFTYFLHADRLNEYRVNGVIVTPFLMKRDDKGISSNGQRLLKEKHPFATLVTDGFFKDPKKKGNFIVVDLMVMVYEYDQQTRKVKKLIAWPYAFFNGCKIDHFALKTEVTTTEGVLVFNSLGKQFVDFLTAQNIKFVIHKRKWYKKILGYRSGKWWKASIASIFYMFILFIGIAMIFGEDTTESAKTKVTTTTENSKSEADSLADEQKKKDEEAARLDAEQKKKEEEAARLAAEQKAKEEEAARLAAEQKAKEEEAARLAAEQKAKEEEAVRLAEEKRQQEEAAKQQEAQSVFYANCTAVREAGAAPIYKGQPGYSTKLDRDGDGIACDQ